MIKQDGPLEDTVFTEISCHSKYDTIKILPNSTAISAEPKPLTTDGDDFGLIIIINGIGYKF